MGLSRILETGARLVKGAMQLWVARLGTRQDGQLSDTSEKSVFDNKLKKYVVYFLLVKNTSDLVRDGGGFPARSRKTRHSNLKDPCRKQ